MDFQDHDPDAAALLLVQQFLHEQDYVTALREVEKQCGLLYVSGKLPRGSMLLEMVYQRMEQHAAADATADDDGERAALEAEEMALLKGGRPQCVVEHVACIDNLHAANIIAARCWPGRPQFLSGSGNGEVKLIMFSGDLMWTAQLGGGGVLSLDIRLSNGTALLLVGSMDGSVAVLDANEGSVLAKSKPHSKYCVRVVWGPSEASSTVVSASWDNSLVVQRWQQQGEGEAVAGALEEVHREVYTSAVTDAVFLQGATLAVARRSSNYLTLFCTDTRQEVGRVNMNATGDDHVSFTASYLSLSPCGKYLLVSTDGARIIMLAVSGWRQVRNFFGLPIEKFHQPCTAWHHSGHYFYAAAAHGQVYVFHVGSTKVAATFKAHDKNVRALDYERQQRCLVTGSFDRKVQVYRQPD